MIQIFGSYFMKKSKILKILLRFLKFLFFVTFFSSMNFVESCFPTSPGGTPITTTTLPSGVTTTTTTTTTTTAITGDCCPELFQNISAIPFADGIMTFAYNDNTCRSTATVTCGQPQGQGLELQAAIVVNQINFVEFGPDTVTFPATCNNGVWQMADPPLTVMSLECRLTDPA